MEVVVHWINTLVVDPYVFGVEPNPANTPLSFDYSPGRQFLVVWGFLAVAGFISYFLICSISYLYTFVIRKNHYFPEGIYVPRQQLIMEMSLSSRSIIVMGLLTVPLELCVIYGYSNVYYTLDDRGWIYLFLSPVFFIVFTDTLIYWIHWAIHQPGLYSWLHKPHHEFKEVTPFSALAFHPLDGWSQGLPYHIFVILFPFNNWFYFVALFIVQLWTINIHDRQTVGIPGVNGAAHHDLHHLYFNYNYGQYFTFWDRLMGTYWEPGAKHPAIALKEKKKN